mmetsp:Transcript_142190/g.318145  ORF Transcript_142190/g.318145 Transcript_142190/m.318145 type:complete len:264 (-) Transcript_142190:223-1014(-)
MPLGRNRGEHRHFKTGTTARVLLGDNQTALCGPAALPALRKQARLTTLLRRAHQRGVITLESRSSRAISPTQFCLCSTQQNQHAACADIRTLLERNRGARGHLRTRHECGSGAPSKALRDNTTAPNNAPTNDESWYTIGRQSTYNSAHWVLSAAPPVVATCSALGNFNPDSDWECTVEIISSSWPPPTQIRRRKLLDTRGRFNSWDKMPTNARETAMSYGPKLENTATRSPSFSPPRARTTLLRSFIKPGCTSLSFVMCRASR